MHEKKIMAANSPSPTLLTNRFQEALVFATELHSTQVRKISGIPYISHLLSVTALVLEDCGTEDEAIARSAPLRDRLLILSYCNRLMPPNSQV